MDGLYGGVSCQAQAVAKMASPSTTAESFTLESVVRGHHIHHACLPPFCPLEVHLATAVFGLLLVGSWLVENTDVGA